MLRRLPHQEPTCSKPCNRGWKASKYMTDRNRWKAIHTEMTRSNQQGSPRGNTRHSSARTIPVKNVPGPRVDESVPTSTDGRTTESVSPSQAGVASSGENNLTEPLLPTLLKGGSTTQ